MSETQAVTDTREDVPSSAMYEGPERRIHTVFRTFNHEYHVRGGLCVAVREIDSGVWISDHEAIGTRMDLNLPGEFFLGKSLLFSSPYYKIRTSTVKSFERPDRQIVDAYAYVWAVCPG